MWFCFQFEWLGWKKCVVGFKFIIDMIRQWHLHWFAWKKVQFGAFKQVYILKIQVVKLSIVLVNMF